MRAVLSILFVSAILVFSSCGVKEQCEQNHEGNICVGNYTGKTVEVYVNNVLAFELKTELSNCVAKPVGVYSVRFISLDKENTIEVSVEECKNTEVNVSF